MYFLNINKPRGISSFDVIRHLRKQLNIRCIGHSGTLDPLAEGVLVIGIKKAAKLLQYLDDDKTYIAELKFGYTTDTFDDEGEKTFVKIPDFSKEKLVEVLKSFEGKSVQIPPKYSAIKKNGKKLCDIVRKNNADEINISDFAREIEIYSIELINFSNSKNDCRAKIKVHCKKGTYIRSLANDIGQKLATGAYLTSLIRTQAGDFSLENSDNLGNIDDINQNYNKIDVLEKLKLPSYSLNDSEFKRIINGAKIKVRKENTAILNSKNSKIMLIKDNKLVSIAKLEDNIIKPEKNFFEP